MKHPITPPPELVQEWIARYEKHCWDLQIFADLLSCTAARWGADQELEACCEYLARCAAWEPEDVQEMLDLRRPKPPTLKEQTLEVVTGLEKRWDLQCDLACLRRALEALDD